MDDDRNYTAHKAIHYKTKLQKRHLSLAKCDHFSDLPFLHLSALFCVTHLRLAENRKGPVSLQNILGMHLTYHLCGHADRKHRPNALNVGQGQTAVWRKWERFPQRVHFFACYTLFLWTWLFTALFCRFVTDRHTIYVTEVPAHQRRCNLLRWPHLNDTSALPLLQFSTID